MNCDDGFHHPDSKLRKYQKLIWDRLKTDNGWNEKKPLISSGNVTSAPPIEDLIHLLRLNFCFENILVQLVITKYKRRHPLILSGKNRCHKIEPEGWINGSSTNPGHWCIRSRLKKTK
ncbi:unnamed protein product, partial [Nesidiocoris tenuis]